MYNFLYQTLIFPVISGYSLGPLAFSLKKTFFSISCKMNLSGFVYLWSFHLSWIFWNTALLDVGFLAGRCFIWALWMCYFTANWFPLFLMRIQRLILLGFPFTWWLIFHLMFSRFSPCFRLSSFVLSFVQRSFLHLA